MNPYRLALLLLAVWIQVGCVMQSDPDLNPTLTTSERETMRAPRNVMWTQPDVPEVQATAEERSLDFADRVDHIYFPLTPGMLLVYEGTVDGSHRRDEIRVSSQQRIIAGVPCTAMLQNVFIDGELRELTTEWFAQDVEGNVWKFGELSLELVDGAFLPNADSWEAAVDGANEWIFLGADPQVGDVFLGNRQDGFDILNIVSTTQSINVPAGAFLGNCMEVDENVDEPDDADVIIYAPNVGMVSETSANGQIQLISMGRE